MSLLKKIHAFTATLSRAEFYDFYALITCLTSPSIGDYLYVQGEIENLKKIVRRLRITVMFPRFSVDYAEPFTPEEALEVAQKLRRYLPCLEAPKLDYCVKLINALEILGQGAYTESDTVKSVG